MKFEAGIRRSLVRVVIPFNQQVEQVLELQSVLDMGFEYISTLLQVVHQEDYHIYSLGLI